MPSTFLRAIDEAHFGDGRTLNVRDRLPTGPEAAARADAWLRLKQVEGVREVLIITGRGSHGVAAFPVVRTHVAKCLTRLRRAGVVASVAEHTPGSYVVKLAPMSALLAAPERVRSGQANPARSLDPSLAGLSTETRRIVHDLAVRILASLGVHGTSRTMISEEVGRQVDLLSHSKPRDVDHDVWIRAAALRVLSELELSEP